MLRNKTLNQKPRPKPITEEMIPKLTTLSRKPVASIKPVQRPKPIIQEAKPRLLSLSKTPYGMQKTVLQQPKKDIVAALKLSPQKSALINLKK